MKYCPLRYRRLYHAAPPRPCVYLIVVKLEHGESYCKIGKTFRLSHRLNNLKQSLWLTPSVYVISCFTPHEAAALERHLHQRFAFKRVNREWFKDLTPGEVEGPLGIFNACLSVEPYQGGTLTPLVRGPRELSYTIALA
jgi:hypothetical protein